MSPQSQFSLMTKRRFLPFFITQFLGAFNDNIYKNALLLMVAFAAATSLPFNSALFINLAAGLFILPFFLFSGIAGQLADKYEKSLIIRRIKLLEIGIMAVACVFIMTQNYLMMLILLFLMGTQSAFFGPVKYAIIPQHLSEEELVGGNALVEMGTFVAILAGTLGAGMLTELDNVTIWVSCTVMVLASLGWFASRYIPESRASAPDLNINWNIFTQTIAIVRASYKDKAIFQSILAISWFWALGAAYLTQLPNLSSKILNGEPQVVSIMLTAFIVGVAAGSLLCDKLSGRQIEIGIVPIGSIGLTIFGVDLYFAIDPVTTSVLIDISTFLSHSQNLRVLFDLSMLGAFGGLFIVPLYTFIQQRTKEDHRARVIASLNVMNSLFMVGSAVLGMILLGVVGLSIAEFFLILSIANLVVCLYIYLQVPEFTLRFAAWMLSHVLYRVKRINLKHIPKTGSVILTCNHVSFVDVILLLGSVRRPIRFIMDLDIYNSKPLHWVFNAAKAIPICSPNRDIEIYNNALKKVRQELNEGHVVMIFPEGKITRDGELNSFRPGIETIIRDNPVPLVPMVLRGLWGSMFSHKGKPAFTKPPRRLWAKIEIEAFNAWEPEQVSAAALEKYTREVL